MSRRKQARPRSYKLDETDDADVGEVITNDRGGVNETGVEVKDRNGKVPRKCNIIASLLTDDVDTVADDSTQLSPLSYDKNGEDVEGGSPCSVESKASPQGVDNSPNAPPTLPHYLVDDVIENFPFSVGASNDYPYPCYACDKSFLKRGHLQKHEQVHSADWQYSCVYCGKKFRHKRSRDRHSKQHTGDKKYRCIKCDAAFARSDHLKVHYRTHDQFKPYKCTLCNRSYSTPLSLTIHVSQHNDLKTTRTDTYRCGFCRTTYTEVKDLQTHIQVYHQCIDNDESVNNDDNDKDDMVELEDPSVDPADWNQCMSCSAMFPTSQQLANHVATSHSSPNRMSPSPKPDGRNHDDNEDDAKIKEQFIVNDHAASIKKKKVPTATLR